MINPIFSKEKLTDLFSELEKATNIIILGHKSPDGDAVGSTLALHHYLRYKNIESIVIMPDGFPNFLNGMKGVENIKYFDSNKEEVIKLVNKSEVVFTLDFNDQSRIGKEFGEVLKNTNVTKVMIDHHQQPDDYATFTFSDTKSCSTAQLVYEFIEANNDLSIISREIAECIYTGILTDTGSFRFPSTTQKTHEIASFLLNTGLKHSEIHERIYDINTPERLKLMGYMLDKKLEILPEINTAIISLTKEELLAYNTKKGYTEGFVNMALSILGIEIGIFVKEDENMVKISFRSKGDIPVNEFSKKYFHGGGHINAAGGRSDVSVIETVDKIKNLLPDFLHTITK